jgi:hypothetical protein
MSSEHQPQAGSSIEIEPAETSQTHPPATEGANGGQPSCPVAEQASSFPQDGCWKAAGQEQGGVQAGTHLALPEGAGASWRGPTSSCRPMPLRGLPVQGKLMQAKQACSFIAFGGVESRPTTQDDPLPGFSVLCAAEDSAVFGRAVEVGPPTLAVLGEGQGRLYPSASGKQSALYGTKSAASGGHP